VRIAIGMGLGASCLLGCSGGVLDVGSSDASLALQAASVPEVFSAAAVDRARQLCAPPPNTLPWTVYESQADLRASLTGGWLVCSWLAPQDARSLEFTADGHWYTLVPDEDGGLGRAPPTTQELPIPDSDAGSDGGAIGFQGTYTFRDGSGEPSAADGRAAFVATRGLLWFHPEFTQLTGRLMTMNWLTDGSHDTCVFIER
jgi:hypothetical protein